MRHLTIRLQLVWLTLATTAAFALVGATLPETSVVNIEFARGLVAFRESLGQNLSLATLSQFRATLVADMVFLVAYGVLLRQSVLFVGRHAGNRLARAAAVLVMLADATENLCALSLLRAVEEAAAPESLPFGIFPLMNLAAITKWAVLGGVMLFLAVRWRTCSRYHVQGGLRYVAVAVMWSFAVGGLGAVGVATSFLLPGLRAVASSAALLGLATAFLLQFRIVDMMGVALRLIYLARVPLSILVITAGFGPIALGPLSRLLGGILDVPNVLGIAIVTTACVVLAFSCATQINLIRAYGWQRTFDQTLLVLRHRVLLRAVSWSAMIAVASMVFSVGLASLWISTWKVVLGALGGAAFGLGFLFVLEWISLLVAERREGRPMPQLAIPFTRLPVVGDWLRKADAARPPAQVQRLKQRFGSSSIVGRLFGLSSGYIELTPSGTRRLLPGHTFAIVLFGLSLLFYVVVIFVRLPTRSEGASFLVPTAGSIVLLLLLNSWGLSALTFFFDRYRVPLVTALLALTLATGSRACTDYQVKAGPPDVAYEVASPGDVLTKFPRPIVLAAAGGGIQAGAWAARVLQGIDDELRENGGLQRRAALLSGVSGGSMGTLYYGAYSGRSLTTATEQSLESSLDEVASALIGADHLRRLFAVTVGVDRGAALERSWALRLPSDLREETTLREWSERVWRFANGQDATPFPAFIFNTTIVETGAPMAFATTQFPSQAYRDSFVRDVQQYPVVESVNRVFGLSDPDKPQLARDVKLHLATAARLSAAFPFVSPAASLNIEGRPRLHLVDGGYYDNYGLVAVTQWLDDALQQMTNYPAEIGVVLIRGLEESAEEKLQERGWAWQYVAPLSAVLNTRVFAQWAGGMQALKLLAEKWKPRVTIRPYLFDYSSADLPLACQAAPLSWKLSKTQQECIEMAWQRVSRQPAAAALLE